jgi:hypothetical protein
VGADSNVVNTNSKVFEVMDVVNLNLERFEGVEGGIHIIEAIETSNNSLSLVGVKSNKPSKKAKYNS